MHMTPAKMAQAALQVACVLNTPNMRMWSARLASMMLCEPGYDRPTTSRLQSAFERQGTPALPHTDDMMFATVEEIMPHVAASIALSEKYGHPLAELALSAGPALRAAAHYVAGFRGHGAAEAIRDDRQARMRSICEARRGLAAEQKMLCDIRAEFAEPNVAQCAPDAEMALFACIIQGGLWPDIEYTLCQVVGFPCVGEYRDSGLFRVVDEPATLRPGELSNQGQIDFVDEALRKEALKAQQDTQKQDMLEEITRQTRLEVSPDPTSAKPQVAFGPYAEHEVNDLLGKGEWRPMIRFCIEQGTRSDGSVKYRVCDNAKKSRTNEMLGVHETISCEDPSFPVLVAALFAELFGEDREQLVHATDDVACAYRQLRCAHPEYSVVGIWDTVIGDVRYYTMYGHNFGLKSAVLSFNRHTQLISWISKAFFGVCNAAYFDDVDTTEPWYCGATGKHVLHKIAEMAGTPFAEEKNEPFATARTFLGVLSDLSDYKSGSVEMRPKPGRVDKIVMSLKAILRADRLPTGLCSTVCGKVEYTASSGAFGRVGRAPLSALRKWQHRDGNRDDDKPIPTWVQEALQFFIQLLPVLPGRKFFFGKKRRRRRPIILYTDAMYDPNKTPAGMVGIVIYDPEDTESKWRYSSAAVPQDLIDKFRKRKQYVGQLEVLAAVAAFTSRPEQLRDRDVIHFIDNMGALIGMAKGYSADVDSARLVSVFHTMNAALRANVWFEYVPSKANISDLPSRNEFELLRSPEFNAKAFDIVWPPVTAWAGEFKSLFKKYSRVSKKRSRK